MKKTIFLIISLWCSISLYGQQSKINNLDNKNGFNNLKFRTSIKEIKKNVNLKKSVEIAVNGGTIDYYKVKNAGQLYTFGKYRIRNMVVGFFNNKISKTSILAYVEVNLTDSKYLADFRLLNEMLEDEYGLPTKITFQEDSFELSRDNIAYESIWRGEVVLLRLTKWNEIVNLEMRGNTYRYYDIEIYNSTAVKRNDGF